MHIYDRFSEKELEILRARAERAARSSQDDQQEEALTVLVVMAGGEKYALPVEATSAVYEDAHITPVPCVSAFVAGITNIRGYIILTLDLAVLLGLPRSTAPDDNILVTIADDTLNVAFRVSEIGGVESVPLSSLIPIPPNLPLTQANYVQGLLPDGIALLNVDAILNDPVLSANNPGAISKTGDFS